DMHDQSGSGYDLALASFGVRAGLADQQIVDLIVHNRRQHGNAQRTRTEYFTRTIGKARRSESSRADGIDGLPQNGRPYPDDDGPSTAVDEVTRKAQLCERLSSVLGVSLLRLQKVPATEPAFLMELENGRITFDITRLTSQRSVKLALAG